MEMFEHVMQGPVITTIYKDGFAAGWRDASWGCSTCDFADTDNVGQHITALQKASNHFYKIEACVSSTLC